MIVVIADDFTGAAEIAGLGLQYGLKVTMELDTVRESDTDLLIIATDTRSMSSGKAYESMRELKKELMNIEYDWIFKKTDSVFRGHILSELKALLDINLKKKVLLVTSNPELGRKIVDGKYYINNIPLNKTGFADDPEYPIESADVVELLGANGDIPIKLLSTDENIVKDGIYIGEAGTLGDLKKLASKVTKDIFTAGASGFFGALLEKHGYKKVDITTNFSFEKEKKFLIVQGSAYNKKDISSKILKQENIFISNMPEEIFYNKENSQEVFTNWLHEIIDKYKAHNKVLLRIDQPVARDKKVSKRLRDVFADLIAELFKKVSVSEIIIDGGATAYSIVLKLNYKKFYPMMQIATGVIRMKVEENPNLCITLKPGSYALPESLLTSLDRAKAN
ncbi:hypothetical protein MNBD_IGNAVI01-416 [hydrothermal vent metagenome]|uniref:BRCT domain-containing protein n=1 Tax=hydrothermal vent metagenome TaxID=652676 RepID=A0A3B1BRZ2_9ZZZZ